ncbi:MAG TPA: hypothetical protein PK718_01365 [Candidatus Methanofastidiosa archaeon]|nr:hypothetical protein [Candidatus Methanofastidiosa archaeon]HPR41181.1 hypothetical protein [Candidatus Methanofastidiosa archaeon]
MRRKKFKKHEICLLIDAIIHDEHAVEVIYDGARAPWALKYLKDDDDKAVGITLLFERLYMANHLAMDYDERAGWKSSPFEIPMIDMRYLLDSTEWRQLEGLELLQLLLDLKDALFSENNIFCFASDNDLEQLNALIIYYYSKYLREYIDKNG